MIFIFDGVTLQTSHKHLSDLGEKKKTAASSLPKTMKRRQCWCPKPIQL